MTTEELLLQLKDIQPPPQPAWWLLAPGHLLILAILVALPAVVWLLLRRRRANRLVRLADRELRLIESNYRQTRDSRLLAVDLSRWLRQVALLAYPSSRLQRISGEDWLEFLDRDIGDKRFSRGCGRVFGSEVYRARVRLDANRVIELCEQWLYSIRPRLRRRRGRVQ